MLNRRKMTLVMAAAMLVCGCRVKQPPRRCPDGSCQGEANRSEVGWTSGPSPLEERRTGGPPYSEGVNSTRVGLRPTLRFSETPVVNLPLHARCRNYAGGSCVIASTVSLFRWQGRDDLADLFRRAYSGGQSASSLHAKLEARGVRYAYTTSGDAAFLDWACRTRRGAGVTFFANHFICLVHLDGQRAILLDNNRIGQYITLPRDEFLRRWRGYGGWATTPVYSPAAPLAWK
jgi:hypothetical protein